MLHNICRFFVKKGQKKVVTNDPGLCYYLATSCEPDGEFVLSATNRLCLTTFCIRPEALYPGHGMICIRKRAENGLTHKEKR